MRNLQYHRKCQSQFFLFIMAQEVAEESMHVAGSMTKMKESKISVCFLPSVELRALDFPKHMSIK